MIGRALLILLKVQLCLLMIMFIFAKFNDQSLSDSFYFYLISMVAMWALITLYA